MDIDEAIALEEQHNAFEQERRARAEARREKMTMPSRQAGPGRFQTREEYEAAVWRFMSHKPTDSDMEGGDDEDDDYEDPDEGIYAPLCLGRHDGAHLSLRSCDVLRRRGRRWHKGPEYCLPGR